MVGSDVFLQPGNFVCIVAQRQRGKTYHIKRIIEACKKNTYVLCTGNDVSDSYQELESVVIAKPYWNDTVVNAAGKEPNDKPFIFVVDDCLASYNACLHEPVLRTLLSWVREKRCSLVFAAQSTDQIPEFMKSAVTHSTVLFDTTHCTLLDFSP